MRIIHALLALSLLLTAGESPARERIALVIGNAGYHIQPLDTPLNDARDVAAALRDSGFRVTLTLDADQQAMETAISDFVQTLHADSEALFYYAGHAAQAKDSERENYLIPIGAIPQIRRSTHLRYKAVPASLVLREMKYAGSPLNIIILDACRNSPFRGFSRDLGRGLERMPTADGALIAYSTAPGKVALDSTGARNSPYTGPLVKFMRQPGLTLEQVLKNTRREVKRLTDKKQTPWYESSLDGYFYFVPKAVGSAPTQIVLPQTARLVVRSNQYGDEAWIDGKSRGPTPVEVELPVGRHQVRVTKDGFENYEEWLELREDSRVVARLEVESQGNNTTSSAVIPQPVDSPSGKRILRYVAYDNGTALDTKTGLIWMRCAMGQTWHNGTCKGRKAEYKWKQAIEIHHRFAGHEDWRLPTIDELRTLLYCSGGKPDYFPGDWGDWCGGYVNERPTITQSVFPNCPASIFWSSSSHLKDPGYEAVWRVAFSDGSGGSSSYKGHVFGVRLVRSGQPTNEGEK